MILVGFFDILTYAKQNRTWFGNMSAVIMKWANKLIISSYAITPADSYKHNSACF